MLIPRRTLLCTSQAEKCMEAFERHNKLLRLFLHVSMPSPSSSVRHMCAQGAADGPPRAGNPHPRGGLRGIVPHARLCRGGCRARLQWRHGKRQARMRAPNPSPIVKSWSPPAPRPPAMAPLANGKHTYAALQRLCPTLLSAGSVTMCAPWMACKGVRGRLQMGSCACHGLGYAIAP